MNRMLSAILLLPLIIFGCSDKNSKHETKSEVPTIQSSRFYKCKDRAGLDYVLELTNGEIENKPVTVIGFGFKSASKNKGNASAYWLEIKKDGADLKILENETVIDGDTVISDDFFLDSVVKYYLAVKRFELDDDTWKRISIVHSMDLERNHPYHNSKSTCSLISQE